MRPISNATWPASAKYSPGPGYARASKVSGREARCWDACSLRRKGPPKEMAASERPNTAAADTRAADRTAEKTHTPAPASEAPRAESHVSTEATAYAATT